MVPPHLDLNQLWILMCPMSMVIYPLFFLFHIHLFRPKLRLLILVPHTMYVALSLFSHSKIIHHTTITLPNGHTVDITRIGIVPLSDSLILHNILFVPLFSFNLLNVRALALSHSCCVNFSSASCITQDLTWGLTIGKGSRHNNLYFLELGALICNFMFSCSVLSKHDA